MDNNILMRDNETRVLIGETPLSLYFLCDAYSVTSLVHRLPLRVQFIEGGGQASCWKPGR